MLLTMLPLTALVLMQFAAPGCRCCTVLGKLVGERRGSELCDGGL